jgi:predicted GNAT family N-acyltransferase
MCRQFFDTQSGEVRERLAEATARVRDLELFTFGGSRMLAAAMMYEGERAIGLYNICVDGTHRRRGWGASVVQQLLGECARREKPAVLQCSAGLEAWYSKLGFKSTGKLFTWSIPGN